MKSSVRIFICSVCNGTIACVCAHWGDGLFETAFSLRTVRRRRPHYNSFTKISTPSSLAVIDGKLPVDTEHFPERSQTA